MQRWLLVLVLASVLGGCGDAASASKPPIEVITTWADTVVAGDWAAATAMIGREPERWERVMRGKDGTDDYSSYKLVGDPVVLTTSTEAMLEWTRVGDPKPQCMTVVVYQDNKITIPGWSLCPDDTWVP